VQQLLDQAMKIDGEISGINMEIEKF